MDRLKMTVSKTVMSGNSVADEDAVKGFLRDREDAIRCVLAGDRPGQRESDAEDLDRFIEQLAVIDSLEVEYTLPGYQQVTESVGWAVERHEAAARRRTPYVTRGVSGKPPIQLIAKALADYLPYPGVSNLILILQASPEEFEERLRLIDAPVDLLDMDIKGAEQTVVSFGSDESSAVTSDVVLGVGERTVGAGLSTRQETGEDRTTTETDPQSALINPEGITFAFESQFDLNPETPDETTSAGSSTRSPSSGNRTSNPEAAGKRNATDRVGSAILRRYEFNRLARDNPSYGQDTIQSCVVSVEKPDDVDTARETEAVRAVLQWLTEGIGLDRQYPGFDYLVLEPSFVAEWEGESVTDTSPINRLIELKSKRGDGRDSLSLNEWLTATADTVAEQYYLYVIGNLGIDRGGEFVREIENPANVLESQWEERQQSEVSIKVNSKRFSSHGAVTQTPLVREE